MSSGKNGPAFDGGAHIKQVFSDGRLRDLVKKDSLMDITLIAGPRDSQVKIRAHRAVLALASQYFWDMFVEGVEDCKKEEHVRGIDPECLQMLVDYIYTGNFQLTEENVDKIHAAATILKIEGFIEKCEEYLTVNVDDKNWDHRLKFARLQNLDDLTDVVISHISSDYLRYLQSPQFLDLPIEDVFTVLSAPIRLDNPEETIFSSVLKWLKFKPSERARNAGHLLEDIDLRSLPEDFFEFNFDREDVLHTKDCIEIYNKFTKKPVQSKTVQDEDVFIFPEPASNTVKPKPKLIKSENSEGPPPQEPSSSAKKRPHSVARKAAIVSNGTKEGEEDNTPTKLSKTENGDNSLKRKPLARKKTGGLRKNYETIKTQSETDRSKSDVEVASPASKSSDPSTLIIASADNPTSKAEHVPALMKDANQISNGNVVYKILYLRMNVDEHVARVMMSDLCQKFPVQGRVYHKCNKATSLLWVSEVRRLYALGGVDSVYNEKGSSKLVRYSNEVLLIKNSDKDKFWMKGPDMHQARTNFTPVIVGDYIYAIGGAEGVCGNEAVNCAERLNVKAKKPAWEEIDYLNRARQGYGAGVIDGKIYACGGYGAEDEQADSRMGILSTVECYDPGEDKWTLVSSMMFERHNFSVAVLDSKLYAIGGGGIHTHTDFDKDKETMKSVEMYDPKENCWNKVASMNRPRKDGSAVVLNGKIYAIGGDVSQGDGTGTSSVEVYSPNLDKWQVISEELDKEGYFGSVVVVDLKS